MTGCHAAPARPGTDPRRIGRIQAVVATPIDMAGYSRLNGAWDTLKGQLIAEVDRDYRIYDGLSFKRGRFAAYLEQAGIPWPRLPSGAPALDDETFRRQARLYRN